jgi:hypothetical protein
MLSNDLARQRRKYSQVIRTVTTVMVVFVCGFFSSVLAIEQEPKRGVSISSQQFASVSITLGMPEAEAVRTLSNEFSVVPVSNSPSLIMIRSKDREDSIGSINIRNGRVVSITSEWTPRVDRTGAFAEALFTLLSRAGSASQGSQHSVACSIDTIDGATAGTDTQLRIATIVCDRQTIRFTISRVNGGSSQVELQLITD